VKARPLTPPPEELRRDSVALRLLEESDAEAVARACRDALIPRFTFMPEDITVDKARRWIQNAAELWPDGRARFAITDAGSGLFLGSAGIGIDWKRASADIYYWLDPVGRGRGAASITVGLLADWAFDEVGVERLELLTDPANQPSEGVADRCGFTREGILRAYEPFKGSRPDVACWSLLRSDPRPWLYE
jgi:RimJ/RimL family protein N-acetyltransferase